MCGLVGLGVLFDLCFYPLLPQRKKYFTPQKQNKKINVNFALLSKSETPEQLIHVPLLSQDLHKTPEPQPTFASGEHMMADPVRTLEKYISYVFFGLHLFLWQWGSA